jgi:adiponectin receptor
MKSFKKMDKEAIEFTQLVYPGETLEYSLQRTDKDKPFIGRWEEAREYNRDNEYIKTGYRVNFNKVKHIFQSLFIFHNESINIWSHLLGAVLFVIFVGYIIVWISPSFYFSSLDYIKMRLGINADENDSLLAR